MSEFAPAQPRPLARALYPWPQRLRELPQPWRVPPSVQVACAAPVSHGLLGLDWLERALQARGHRLLRGQSVSEVFEASVALRVADFDQALFAAEAGPRGIQSYQLRVGPDGISIVAASTEGLQHAFATCVQLIALGSGAPGQLIVPGCEIDDFPDFAERGVMLDISRDKVPTLASLKALVDKLARWKLNQLQLYMEHTFAYPGHEIVWQHASPLTGQEVRELDAYCAERHVELVPNQNSFGHMQRWLVHAPYRALAECPDGFEHPWTTRGEPYGLCATDPASLTFLEGLYDSLLPNFRSGRFNVGLDETLDLGAGRSRAACAARGTERVYLDFLHEVHRRVRARGKTMQFWGDIILNRPDLIAELPAEAVALLWGYESDHPFAAHVALFRAAGLACYVCPGTSSWNSIAGRTENALLNLARAAREGFAGGATGYLITDWGDHGHLQPLAVSYLGLFAGAGFCWNSAAAREPLSIDFARLLDRHVFVDAAPGLGRAAYALGNAYLHAGSLRPNASVLFWILVKPERVFTPPGVTAQTLAQTLAHLESAGADLERSLDARGAACPEREEVELAQAELTFARDLLRFACKLGIARCASWPPRAVEALDAETRKALRAELAPLILRHRTLFLARNRPGGLDDSAARLERVFVALEGERSARES